MSHSRSLSEVEAPDAEQRSLSEVPKRRFPASGVSPDDDPHDFQVQNKETNNLPGEEFPPETGALCGYRRVSFILVSPDYILGMHSFLNYGYLISDFGFSISDLPADSLVFQFEI